MNAGYWRTVVDWWSSRGSIRGSKQLRIVCPLRRYLIMRLARWLAADAYVFVLLPDIVLASRAAELVAVLSASGKPAIYTERPFVEAGGLISLGPNLVAGCQRIAAQVDRVLKGTKPGDIPFELPSTFELLVNVRATRAARIDEPESVLARADETIE